MKIIPYSIIVLLLATFVTAQEASQEAGTTPDSIFYGLDTALEKIRLVITFKAEKEAEIHLNHAEERLAELKEMVNKNETKYTEKLIEKREKSLNKSKEEIKKAEEKGVDVSVLAAKVQEVTSKHIIVLQGLLDKVPEQAREHIQNAIERSSRSQAVEAITKEKQMNKSMEKPEEAMEKGEVMKKPEPAMNVSSKEASKKPEEAMTKGTGQLVMQITDKQDQLNITSLEITISNIKVHAAGSGGTSEETCTSNNVTEEVCTNETITEVIPNCVNETLVEEVCTNVTTNETTELICTNQTIIQETCTNQTINTTTQSCNNVTTTVDICTNESFSEEGWFTVVEGPKTYDLIKIKNVKEFLGSKVLTAGKYTQIRLNVDTANLMIGNQSHPLSIPSGTLKLVNEFDITAGAATTLTLDFDADKSVHQAGSKYIMRPTIKVIEG